MLSHVWSKKHACPLLMSPSPRSAHAGASRKPGFMETWVTGAGLTSIGGILDDYHYDISNPETRMPQHPKKLRISATRSESHEVLWPGPRNILRTEHPLLLVNGLRSETPLGYSYTNSQFGSTNAVLPTVYRPGIGFQKSYCWVTKGRTVANGQPSIPMYKLYLLVKDSCQTS